MIHRCLISTCESWNCSFGVPEFKQHFEKCHGAISLKLGFKSTTLKLDFNKEIICKKDSTVVKVPFIIEYDGVHFAFIVTRHNGRHYFWFYFLEDGILSGCRQFEIELTLIPNDNGRTSAKKSDGQLVYPITTSVEEILKKPGGRLFFIGDKGLTSNFVDNRTCWINFSLKELERKETISMSLVSRDQSDERSRTIKNDTHFDPNQPGPSSRKFVVSKNLGQEVEKTQILLEKSEQQISIDKKAVEKNTPIEIDAKKEIPAEEKDEIVIDKKEMEKQTPFVIKEKEDSPIEEKEDTPINGKDEVAIDKKEVENRTPIEVKEKEDTPMEEKEEAPTKEKDEIGIEEKEEAPTEEQDYIPIEEKQKIAIEDVKKKETPIAEREKNLIEETEEIAIEGVEKEEAPAEEEEKIPMEEKEKIPMEENEEISIEVVETEEATIKEKQEMIAEKEKIAIEGEEKISTDEKEKVTIVEKEDTPIEGTREYEGAKQNKEESLIENNGEKQISIAKEVEEQIPIEKVEEKENPIGEYEENEISIEQKSGKQFANSEAEKEISFVKEEQKEFWIQKEVEIEAEDEEMEFGNKILIEGRKNEKEHKKQPGLHKGECQESHFHSTIGSRISTNITVTCPECNIEVFTMKTSCKLKITAEIMETPSVKANALSMQEKQKVVDKKKCEVTTSANTNCAGTVDRNTSAAKNEEPFKNEVVTPTKDPRVPTIPPDAKCSILKKPSVPATINPTEKEVGTMPVGKTPLTKGTFGHSVPKRELKKVRFQVDDSVSLAEAILAMNSSSVKEAKENTY